MWDILTERPIHIALGGGLVTAILFVFWLQIPRRGLLVATAAAVLLTVGLVVAERMVVTDRESVVNTLYEIAETVKTKDLDKLLVFIHSQANHIRNKATREYNSYRLDDVRITQVWDVEVNSTRQPKTAEVAFNVLVTGSGSSPDFGTRRVPIYMVVKLEEEAGTWRVTHYKWDRKPHRALLRDDAR
jgi:hypothetical protein